MQKILITGCSGFVSHHLLQYLDSGDEQYAIAGISRHVLSPGKYKNLHVKTYALDLKNPGGTRDIIAAESPDYIIHLASNSSVAYSWQSPVESFQNNTNIFLNVIESVRILKLPCRILSVGSSEEYGIVNPDTLPLHENHELNPISPYAVARVSQEMLSKIYSDGYGQDIIITRSFNHIGSGQRDNFVISSFAKKIALIKRKELKRLEVGNVDIVRDFLDVRDVVRAYMLLLKKGKAGEIYNVCRGVGYSLREILNKMMQISGTDFEIEINHSLIRPSDNPIIIGDNSKIKSACGWQPEIEIEESLKNIIEYWDKELNKRKNESVGARYI
jgi:GDP-4-dehydro-6-deoxy-D-mannose reductase